jgi:glucan phosphorylase
LDALNNKALTIGFARRFATYKRAHLIFNNLERLASLVNKHGKPVHFIFAGKAHPHDKAGEEFIKKIVEISKHPEFMGKITFVENYDMAIARKLVQGVDIWLNLPTRPLEASGTSGQKAVLNGVMNFSVLDGWWAEGYTPDAGWALPEENTYSNPVFQDELDAETVYHILEDEIIPLYYNLDHRGIPVHWISNIKNCIAQIAPRFTMKRQLDDYCEMYYEKLIRRTRMIEFNDFEVTKRLAHWKRKILRSWDSIEVVSVLIPDSTTKPLQLGAIYEAEIVLDVNELSVDDIGIEVLFGQKQNDEVHEILYCEEMEKVKTDKSLVTFKCTVPATRAGVFDYAFRMFPKNNLLPHRQDFNLIRWI